MIDEKANRDYAIDIARGIAIILVVVGHTAVPLSFPNHLAFSVHLPLFFFLSGFLMKAERYSFWEYTKKRAFRLLLPYFIFAFVSACKNSSNFPMQIASALFCSGKISSVLPQMPDQPWFLPCLFLSELVFFGLRKLERFRFGRIAEMLLSFFFSACGFFLMRVRYLPWSLDIALFVQVFLFAGLLFRQSGFLKRSVSVRATSFFLFASIWVGVIVLTYCREDAYRYVVSLNERQVSLISLGVSFAGMFAVLCFSSLLGQIRFLRAPFAYFGKISIVVYLFHLSGLSSDFLAAHWLLNALVRLAYSAAIAELFRLIPVISGIYGLPPRFQKKGLLSPRALGA